MAGALGERHPEMLVDQSPVRQLSQRIDMGKVGDLRLGGITLNDVGFNHPGINDRGGDQDQQERVEQRHQRRLQSTHGLAVHAVRDRAKCQHDHQFGEADDDGDAENDRSHGAALR